ncbi:hypothetical protein CC117_25915 [Parafrankia colletiae]|uniref:Acyl-CoA dehydrogenase n=1 Tax=Parafrankia colletiae TaxID=573497 RepID=A0A1S1QCW2_9ACTN|nr:hypothetical protein CC117_25915 [Parafrankia colletiae]
MGTPVIGSDAEAVAVARRYAESIAGTVIERDRSAAVPVDALQALDASGLLGITVPVDYGGADVSPVTLAEVVRTIAAVDPALAQIPQGHFLFVDVLALWGSTTQRQRLFTEILAGARLGSGLAERGGRHAQDLHTRLRTDGAGLRLDGSKYYSTGSITARWIGVSALDESEHLALAFVERDAPGVTVDDDWNVMGQRATVSGTTTLRAVPVDPALVIPYHRAFGVPQQLVPGPSSCTPRSRSASPVARCGTPARSSAPGPGRSSRPPVVAGRNRRRRIRTRFCATGGWPPGCAPPRSCCAGPLAGCTRSDGVPGTRAGRRRLPRGGPGKGVRERGCRRGGRRPTGPATGRRLADALPASPGLRQAALPQAGDKARSARETQELGTSEPQDTRSKRPE